MEKGEQEPVQTSTEPQQEETKEVETTEDTENQEKQKEVEVFPIFVRTCTEKQTVIQLQVSLVDNIQDIRQYLYDSIETCFITNYHLYLDGEKLKDYADLVEIEGLKAQSTLEMREAPYDERSIKQHVHRLKEIMHSQESGLTSLFSVFSQEEEVASSPSTDSKRGSTTEQQKPPSTPALVGDFTETAPQPSAFYPPSSNISAAACLKSIAFSGWNPPPGNRRLLGDLIYLEVTTQEGKIFHITGWNKGFFINSTNGNTFNSTPAEKSHPSHSLVHLLFQVSTLFKRNFLALLNANFYKKHPFEHYPVPFPVHPWLAKRERHTYDLNRTEDTNDIDLRTTGQLPDWNEEYQSCKELPRDTIQDRVLRDRALAKVNSDFVAAATKGAIAIVSKSVLPINPLDPERAHMYIYNNIFFSYATDGRDFYKEYGGDHAAYVSVNNDLKGIRALNRVDVKGLYTLATAIIDYRGYRLCAQSIIPGILQREQTSTVVYGSIDNGKKISSDPVFHELMLEASKKLHIKEHEIKSEGETVKLATPVESKGIVGTDGRRYILDLIRLTPRDANYTGKENMITILRPELVATYCEYLAQRKKREMVEKEKAEKKASQPPSTEEEEKPKTEEEKALEQQAEEEALILTAEELAEVALNPNVLCDFELVGSAEEIAEQEELVKNMSQFLTKTIIPLMLEEVAWHLSVPADGQILTTMMHQRGVNMRYLGIITQQCDKFHIVKDICIREMIGRASKHIMREILNQTEEYELAPSIAHFLNCLLAVPEVAPLAVEEKPKVKAVTEGETNGNKKKKKGGKKKKNMGLESKGPSPAFYLTSSSLWTRIGEEVKKRFQYDLAPNRTSVKEVLCTIPTLRSVCQKVGITVEAVDYDFSVATPFKAENILQLFPIVKHTYPENSDGRDLMEAGKAFMSRGRLEIAYELLTDALGIFFQVYGPMHKDIAYCYSNLAMIFHQAKEIDRALDQQEKAVIINEKVLGLDHFNTIHSYGNLALFYHNSNKSKIALSYLKRTLYMGRLLYGSAHPDTATTLTNASIILQDLQKYQQGIDYLLEAVKCYEPLLGADHIQLGSIYHAIAIAYSQLENYKEALVYEKKNYNILHSQVGDEDFRTIESNICLKAFTAKAVQRQIENKRIQEKPVPQLLQKNQRPLQPTGVANPIAASTTGHFGDRPLTELLSYINGKSSTARSFKQRNLERPVQPATAASPQTSDDGLKKKKKKKANKNKEGESM